MADTAINPQTAGTTTQARAYKTVRILAAGHTM